MLQPVSTYYDIEKLKIISKESYTSHYNSVYVDHVNKYNQGIGDIAFDKAGAHLHELYFSNIREYRVDNTPLGIVAHIIEMRYGTYDNFVKSLMLQADRLQGSGWLFMNSAGYINIIPNNRIVKDCVMVIDMWEHAYFDRFGYDRASYLMSHLHIIDWHTVNNRITAASNNKK